MTNQIVADRLNDDPKYREFRSETLRELQSLQKLWRKQDFRYTKEQEERYNYLLAFRREQVRTFYEDKQAWIGPSLAGRPLDESKSEEES